MSPLVHIINTSIESEIFPKQWKISRVCPIPKTDQITDVKDCQPILVLTVFSKIYERVILLPLCSLIETNKICNSILAGYRKGRSTTALLLKLREDIRKAMKSSEVTLPILIDYFKAFDTIGHCILLKKF